MTAPTLGERVADYRRQRGLSQRELANDMKRSESWVSQVERDIQPVERLSVLHALAQAFGVSVRDLRPEAMPEADDADERPNDLDGLRLELSGHPALASLFARSDHPPVAVDVDTLRTEVEGAWVLAHQSRFAALNDALTELLPRLEIATHDAAGDAVTELHALRARAYQAASAAFARQDEPDAAWVAAGRAITAAEQSGDPLASIHRLAWGDGRARRLMSQVEVGWAVSPVGARRSGVTSLATMVCQRVVVLRGRAGPLWLFKSAAAASGCGPVPC